MYLTHLAFITLRAAAEHCGIEPSGVGAGRGRGLPCMETDGATDATGMGGMDTPPKEL